MNKSLWIKKLLLAILLAPALLFCIEGSLRLCGFKHTVRRKMLRPPSVFLEWGTLSVSIPTLLAPGQYFFRAQPDTPLTGPHGFRAPEPPVEKTPGTIRVAFLGGSTTQGGYYAYPQRAAAILNAALGSNRFEVINWACSSYSTFQSRRIFDAEVDKWKPDILMIYHGWNDPPCSEDGYSDVETDRAAQWSHRLGVHSFPDVARLRLAQFVARLLENLDRTWPRPRVNPAEFKDNIKHIIKECREKAIPVVVMIRPWSESATVPAQAHPQRLGQRYGTENPRRIYDKIHAVYSGIQRELTAQEDGVRACDGDACMQEAQARHSRGEYPDGIEIFLPDAMHLSAFGDQLLAESVAQALAPEHTDSIHRYLNSSAYYLRLAEQALEGLLIPDAEYYLQEALRRDPHADVSGIISGIESNREFAILWHQGRCVTPGAFEWKLEKLKQCLELRPADPGVCDQLYGLCVLNGRPDLAANGIMAFEPTDLDALAFWLVRATYVNFLAGRIPEALYYAGSLLALRPDESTARKIIAGITRRPDLASVTDAMRDRIAGCDFRQILEERMFPGLSSPEYSRQIAELAAHLILNPEDESARDELTRMCIREKRLDLTDTLSGLKPPPVRPFTSLNDGSLATFQLSADSPDDTILYIRHPKTYAAHRIFIVVLHPEEGMRAKDVAVVATNGDPDAQDCEWHRISARLHGENEFRSVVRLPEAADGATLQLEVKPDGPASTAPFKTWGLACLSTTEGHERNYVPDDQIIGVRELLISAMRSY